MSLEQFHWAMIPYGIPFSKRFRLYSAALFSNCKLLNPAKIIIIMVVTTISIKSVSFCSFLPNAKELGCEISEWWSEKYDESYGTKIAITLKKNEKRKDQALIFTHFGMIFTRFESDFLSVRVFLTLFTLLKSNHFTLFTSVQSILWYCRTIVFLPHSFSFPLYHSFHYLLALWVCYHYLS